MYCLPYLGASFTCTLAQRDAHELEKMEGYNPDGQPMRKPRWRGSQYKLPAFHRSCGIRIARVPFRSPRTQSCVTVDKAI